VLRRIRGQNVGTVFPRVGLCDAARVKDLFADSSLADLATKFDDSVSIAGEALQFLSEPPALTEPRDRGPQTQTRRTQPPEPVPSCQAEAAFGRKYPTCANEAARLPRH